MRFLLCCASIAIMNASFCWATLSGYYQNDFDPSQSKTVLQIHAAAAIFNYQGSYLSSKSSIPDCKIGEKTCFAEKRTLPDRSLVLYVESLRQVHEPESDTTKKMYYIDERILYFLKKETGWITEIFSLNRNFENRDKNQEKYTLLKEIKTDRPPDAFFMHVINSGDDIDLQVELTYPEGTVYADQNKPEKQVLFGGDLISFK